MVLETCMKLYVAELDFLGKNFLPQKLEKWTKNGPETVFFEFIEKSRSLILLNLFSCENSFYLLCSCTNPIFAKIVVLKV